MQYLIILFDIAQTSKVVLECVYINQIVIKGTTM